MDHQYKGNGVRNIYSNYNQMRGYVECSPINKKICTLSTFPSSNRRNFEDSGKVLTTSVFQFYWSIAVQKMVITTVCVQIENCFFGT